MQDSNLTSKNQQDRVVIHALSMAFGTMTSRVLGLIRDMAFAAMFSRTITDAWGVAFRFPNMFRRLLGEGSLSVSFIPVFVETRNQDPQGLRAQNLVNSFYTLLLILLSTLTLIGIVYAEPVMRLLVSDYFSDIPGKFELTVRMARIMFCFIFLMSTYAYFMGILNALGSFALPAMAPTLFNVAMIISNFIPKEWQVVEGDSIAWGVVVGGFLQTGLLIPALRRKGYFPKLQFKNLFNQDALKVWRNMLPGILGMGLLQITTIINTHFAARLGEGTNTYIYLADRLLELPLSLVSVSLGTALLPTLAQLWVTGQKEKMIGFANQYFRFNLFIAFPAAAGLFCLSRPIVELLFQRGKFNLMDAEITSSVVQIYAFTLLISASVRVLVPAFYAIKNTWLPALISGVCLLFHVLIAPVLMQKWGVQGLVGSTLLSAALNLSLLGVSFHFMIGSFGLGQILLSCFKFLLATAAVVGLCSFYPLLREMMGDQFVAKVISLFTIIVLSVPLYIGLGYLLRMSECEQVVTDLVRKIKRKIS